VGKNKERGEQRVLDLRKHIVRAACVSTFWDLWEGRCTATLEGHDGYVSAVAAGPW
jgi:hypothetical protein